MTRGDGPMIEVCEVFRSLQGETTRAGLPATFLRLAGPQIVLQWDVTEDVMLYASYVEGFKSGGYDNPSNADPDPAVRVPGTTAAAVGAWEFDKEEANSYEMGFKSTLADGVAELNGAVFYTEYDDLQTSVFDGVVGFNVRNAGKATTQGVEIDGRWALHEYFTLSGSLGYLDFEFDNFDVAQCWFGQQQLEPSRVTNGVLKLCDASGERKEYTPEWKAVLTGDFHYPVTDALEMRATVDYQYTDEYLYTPQLDPRSEQDAFSMVNARIALAQVDDKWEIAVIGNNLTDEDFISYGGTGVLARTATQVPGLIRNNGSNMYNDCIGRCCAPAGWISTTPINRNMVSACFIASIQDSRKTA